MQSKAKNTIAKDALILFMITLVAGLLLGLVNEITKYPIEQQKIATKKEAYQLIFTGETEFGYNDDIDLLVKDSENLLAQSPNSFGNVTIDEVVEAKDSSGVKLGYVVSVTSKDGYNGNISLMVGIASDGKIIGIEMLELNETVNLGMKVEEDSFKDKFINKEVAFFSVIKSGSTSDDQIDSISGATISTQATTSAVNAALYFINDCINQ